MDWERAVDLPAEGLSQWPKGLSTSHSCAVVDDTIAGRIYREMIIGKPKWRWFLQYIPGRPPGGPIPPPNQGMADTLKEAQAAFAKRYEEGRWEAKIGYRASAASDPNDGRDGRVDVQLADMLCISASLEPLASSGHGANEELLVLGHGFSRRMLAGLVRAGRAAADRGVMMAGGKPIAVVRVSITAAGRRAIAAEG